MKSAVILLLAINFCTNGSWAFRRELHESKLAYAVFDDNSNDFVIVDREPPREKYVAGANFSNSINQTG